ncbi:hypothetical protein B1R32_10914 [Abditibacterium utsteinense]|uniref:Uncharacterized protein n=1 Tax=Abditibacterium utsteinense TaxID=1960156 RepID=A0A2S8SSA7_9BACT|nr:hypothetical protein [Abditibacterium utsteinense]PQV63675.1 hypothetical protein B1R32_10914 [Abditibacterium utsteinense]
MPAIQDSPSASAETQDTLEDFQNPDLETEETEDEEFSPVHLFLEDFVVTSLLSAGRPLRGGELSNRADFQLPRQGLRESLKDSKIVRFEGREWDAIWRASRKGLSREERSRQPIESMIRELLQSVGKPLPIPVIAREVCLMRNQFDPNMKDAVANVLKSVRFALEVVPDVWLHQDFVLATGADSDERLIKENRLQSDADFEALVEYAEVTKNEAAGIASELMEFTGGPLSQKLIGFFVHRANPKTFSTQKVAAALNDRAQFQPLLGGFVSLQGNMVALRAQVEEFLQQYHSAQLSAEEIQTLLKQRVTPSQVIAPRPDELEELKRLAKNGDGKPLELALVVLDVLEMEKDDAKLVAAFQGLNDALRRDAAWLPTGIGRFLLRESVPAEVGQIPAILKPLQLAIIDPDTREPFDYEMSDEGMEADCAAFIHDSQWEDIGEESEAIFEKVAAPNALRIVVLNHHLRAGTLKLRRIDEPFFDLINGLARLSFKTGNNAPILTGWASRDSGLITGLGDWCEENLPPSGGALLLQRVGQEIVVEISTPDMGTFLTARRVDELEELRENADELSVYEILRRVLGAHPAGMSLPSIWAEVNAVRRTSKRLMCSVLSGYEELVSKQRGPNQFLWTSDASKAGGGFSRSKRKFVEK